MQMCIDEKGVVGSSTEGSEWSHHAFLMSKLKSKTLTTADKMEVFDEGGFLAMLLGRVWDRLPKQQIKTLGLGYFLSTCFVVLFLKYVYCL